MTKSNNSSRYGEVDTALIQESELIKTVLESKGNYRKIIQAGIARWVKDFQDGRVEIKTVEDLKTLIEIDMILQQDDFRWVKHQESLDRKMKR
jgi:hypothetical protein